VGSREEAYKIVQDNAMKAQDGQGRFMDLVRRDPRVTAHLSQDEIDECFTVDYYLRNVPKIFRRVFG
jgi:adenylosuccinate lyase